MKCREVNHFRATFHIKPLFYFILFTHVHLRDSGKPPLLKILLWNPEPPEEKKMGLNGPYA